MKKLMKAVSLQPIHISIITLFSVSLLFVGLQAISPANSNAQQKSMPEFGWIVCEYLGFGDVPGHEPADRFRLCNQNIWQVLAYCLEPDKPIPAEGTICELVNNTFWCGDDVQLLRAYEILPTSTPIPTDTPTPTSTSTPTLTPTSTPTQTQTSTPTYTPTEEISVIFTITPTKRDRMGGSTHLETAEFIGFLLGVLLIGVGITSVLLERENNNHRTK